MIETQLLLHTLSIGMHYRGYRYMVMAVALALEDDTRLAAVIQEIYLPIGRQYGCSWKSVERNMRTVVGRAWKRQPQLLCRIAGVTLSQQPTVSWFIDVITACVRRNELDAPYYQEAESENSL